VNELNSYNHNFRGTYCTCERPYPDPEDVIDDEMIQCVVCEDWYHGRVSHICFSCACVVASNMKCVHLVTVVSTKVVEPNVYLGMFLSHYEC
jgi:hypothetical protein